MLKKFREKITKKSLLIAGGIAIAGGILMIMIAMTAGIYVIRKRH